MGKVLRLLFNHLVVVLLISVIFLSIDQQVLPSIDQKTLKASSETPAATYPYLDFSTYFGGSDNLEHGHSIAVTDDGCYYVLGQTESGDFPTHNAYDYTINGNRDAFIAKFDDSGSLLWSTFFGGSDLEVPRDIAVADDGSCYIVGSTLSTDYPTKNGYQTTFGGGVEDVFIAKFSSSGSLLWSTYLGGSYGFESGFSIAVSENGRSCYVTGETQSTDFPIKDAFSSTFNGGNFDAFVTKFSTNGVLLWSTFLGGGWNDAGEAIAVSRDGSCYITGYTRSSDFPTLNAYDSIQNGDWDVFVTKFSASGSLLWSTYFGGNLWDEALGIAAASDGSCYITGYAGSSNFPTLYAFNSTYSGWGDAFVSKFAVNGSLLWSTYLGGNEIDRGYAIAVISDGRCYVTGGTSSTNFPIKVINSTLSGGFDAFVTCFSTDGSLLWSTYQGGSEGTDKGYGIAVTDDGGCYIIGTTFSDDFPTQNAYDDTLGDSSDAFITKFVDTPSIQPISGYLIFIVALPTLAFLMVIGLIFYKKRK